jgi:hypothetical protein
VCRHPGRKRAPLLRTACHRLLLLLPPLLLLLLPHGGLHALSGSRVRMRHQCVVWCSRRREEASGGSCGCGKQPRRVPPIAAIVTAAAVGGVTRCAA